MDSSYIRSETEYACPYRRFRRVGNTVVPMKKGYEMTEQNEPRELTLADLKEASKPGGPSTLTERTLLEPAAGMDGIVAPAKYASTRTGGATYVFEDRYIPLDDDGRVTVSGKPAKQGERRRVVLIDSRTSQSNRAEAYITQAMEDESSVFAKMPRIKVTYAFEDEAGNLIERVAYDVTLPHRAFDAHIRIGIIDGGPASKYPEYIQARNATPANLKPLFKLSPVTVAFGVWDSTRNKNQLRLPSPYNGEIIGVIANQEEDAAVFRSGARIDPIEASITFTQKDAKTITEYIGSDISDDLKGKFEDGKGNKKKLGKGSLIGLGAIPPKAEDVVDGIAVSDIVRTHVLSFSMLRALHFGYGKEGDESIRVLMAAMILAAMAGSNTELNIRANCMLRESMAPSTVLDKRYGESIELTPLTLEHAEELLKDAYEYAKGKTGLDWHGQTLEVTGNPLVIKNATAETDNE